MSLSPIIAFLLLLLPALGPGFALLFLYQQREHHLKREDLLGAGLACGLSLAMLLLSALVIKAL